MNGNVMNVMRTTHGSIPKPALGFTLVELMVAMVLGLILMAGLATLFANSSQSSTEIEKSIRQIENGRYALKFLNEDVSMAGYYGEASSDLSFGTANACPTAAALATDLGWDNAALRVPVPLTGFSAAQAASLSCLSDYKANTPALLVRRVDTASVVPGAETAGSFYLQTSRCSADPIATRFILSSTTSDFTLRGLACTSINTVQRYITRIYYIARCNECGIDTVPTLKMAELRGTQMVILPLVEGIDDIGYDFAFDTDNNGSPDTYLTGLSGVANAPENDWANVVGVRINVLSRTTEPTPGFNDQGKTYALGLAGMRGPFTDGFKRRAYTITSVVNNVAGPREIP